MQKKDVIKHYKGVGRLALALGVSPSSISQWPEEVPLLRQYQIEVISGGRFKAKRCVSTSERTLIAS